MPLDADAGPRRGVGRPRNLAIIRSGLAVRGEAPRYRKVGGAMRALLSVYDKTGVVEVARGLAELGFDLISTGGTLAALRGGGLRVSPVAEVTGFPEILDGRVKTLHPAIHAGLLARRADDAHDSELRRHGLERIDLLAANLYPFGDTVRDPTVPVADALEQIDIGGPAMVRAAAKNFPAVVVLTDPTDYGPTLLALRQGVVAGDHRRA